MPTSGHYYVIINKKSGTAFDLSGQDQKSIIGFTVHRGDNQKWKFTQFDDGWTIQNKYNGKYLDIEVPNSPGNGVSVVAIDTQNPRKWYVIYDDQFGGWRFRYEGTNQDVDLSDHGNPAPGTPVTLWGHWQGQNQVWQLEDAQ